MIPVPVQDRVESRRIVGAPRAQKQTSCPNFKRSDGHALTSTAHGVAGEALA
jgi:hypothetical protein